MKGKKTGGRQKGVPNKTTAFNKQLITSLLDEYSSSGLMSADFKALEPAARLSIAEKLMHYVLPKMQSTDVDVNIDNSKNSLSQLLANLSQPDDK